MRNSKEKNELTSCKGKFTSLVAKLDSLLSSASIVGKALAFGKTTAIAINITANTILVSMMMCEDLYGSLLFLVRLVWIVLVIVNKLPRKKTNGKEVKKFHL